MDLTRFIWIFILTGLFVCRANGQSHKKDTLCFDDPWTADSLKSLMIQNQAVDTSIKAKMAKCYARSEIAFSAGLGGTTILYSSSMGNWIDDHGLLHFNISLEVQNFNIGARIKTWTFNPATSLNFDGTILPVEAKVNPNIFDWYFGYSLNLKRNFALEPFIGQNYSYFRVVNDNSAPSGLSIDKSMGFLVGTTINKYFHVRDYQYGAVYLSLAYGFTDFSSSHEDFGEGYFDIALGITFKNFFKKKIEKPIR